MEKWKIDNPIEIFKKIVKGSKKIVEENQSMTEVEARKITLEELKKTES